MEQTKKSFLKNMVGFSMTTWISALIGLIASPIATRLFIPDEMGKLNMFSTYAALFASIAYLGLDQAYVRFFREPPGKSTRKGMFTFCTVVPLSFSLVSSLLLLFAWKSVSNGVMGVPDFGIFLCLVIYSFCLVLFRFLSLSYRMEQNAKLYTIQGVVQVLLTKIAYLFIAFHSAQARPAILLLTLLMGAFTLVFTFIQRGRFTSSFVQETDKPFLKEISVYAAPLIPLTVITTLNSYVSTLALDTLMDKAAVGIFTSAVALASTINIVQTGFNTYWAPYVYEHYQNDEHGRFFTVHKLMAALLTGFGLTVTLLQSVVFLLLGAKFRSSVIYFPFLFLSPICYCL
ncbi:MAG: lipopolysaccharide biosynthesis protein, partial [Eubacteriales bacterium]|nr:lipopolysaccharide biosynthesis protein [Eubacteriales bacterium]